MERFAARPGALGLGLALLSAPAQRAGGAGGCGAVSHLSIRPTSIGMFCPSWGDDENYMHGVVELGGDSCNQRCFTCHLPKIRWMQQGPNDRLTNCFGLPVIPARSALLFSLSVLCVHRWVQDRTSGSCAGPQKGPGVVGTSSGQGRVVGPCCALHHRPPPSSCIAAHVGAGRGLCPPRHARTRSACPTPGVPAGRGSWRFSQPRRRARRRTRIQGRWCC